MLANCHRDPKRRPQPFSPDDFNPYATRATSGGGMCLNKRTLPFLVNALCGKA